MSNSRYTQAEAELSYLRGSGIMSFSLALILSGDIVSSLMKKMGVPEYFFIIQILLGVLAYGLMFYSFVALSRAWNSMEDKSGWGFRFKDEYTNALSKKSYIFSLGMLTGWMFFVMMFSKPKIDFFGLSEMRIHDFATITVSLVFLSYSLPILYSYWKKDE